MTAKVITIAQQKGGAGKTTLAAQLAVVWARQGRRLAVVDIDPQGSLAAWAALRRARFGDNGLGFEFAALSGWPRGNPHAALTTEAGEPFPALGTRALPRAESTHDWLVVIAVVDDSPLLDPVEVDTEGRRLGRAERGWRRSVPRVHAGQRPSHLPDRSGRSELR